MLGEDKDRVGEEERLVEEIFFVVTRFEAFLIFQGHLHFGCEVKCFPWADMRIVNT